MRKVVLVGTLIFLLCACSYYDDEILITSEIEQSQNYVSVLNESNVEDKNMLYEDLNGSWSEKDSEFVVFEIDNNKLTHLINGCTELSTTTFELNDDGEFIFPNSFFDYSYIKSCRYENKKIIVTEENIYSDYERVYELYPTDACRYGMVEIIDDEMLPRLQGRWECGNLFLEFEGNIMCYGENDIQEKQLEIIVTRHLKVSHWVHICNKDPREINLGKYGRLRITVDNTIVDSGTPYDRTKKIYTKV